MVVNPPQKPTVRRRRAFAPIAPRSSDSAMTSATTKLPRTLTASVPSGNAAPIACCTSPPIQYRPTEPRSPPTATSSVRVIASLEIALRGHGAHGRHLVEEGDARRDLELEDLLAREAVEVHDEGA